MKFVPAKGSVIGGIPKEKTARITDAMADLQLGIDGLRSQLPAVKEGKRWASAMGSFARTCSVFLRKTVLGDRDRRETRLLDDRVLGSIGLWFDRLRKIPRDRRRMIEVGIGLAGGLLQCGNATAIFVQSKDTADVNGTSSQATPSEAWWRTRSIVTKRSWGPRCGLERWRGNELNTELGARYSTR